MDSSSENTTDGCDPRIDDDNCFLGSFDPSNHGRSIQLDHPAGIEASVFPDDGNLALGRMVLQNSHLVIRTH